ncbi:MAG: NAD(P)H-dependent glycerol-3-phosphate dehydrogenase [Candidatus Komeilibacteria bacterium]|nr:NAD(P)H-dependent glycerol-3-phosphate dehydrogenase [Candidatus Komeilibacteria bacterium]
MQISILGAGRWGSTIAWVQQQAGRKVILWNRGEELIKEWLATRKNKYLSLPKEVEITGDLAKALTSEVIFIAIRAQSFRDFCQVLAKQKPARKLFILAMKGLEEKTGKRLSEIFGEYFDQRNQIGMLAGPGHPQEISKHIPTIMTCAAADQAWLPKAIKVCETPLMKIFPNRDLLGVEVGAAIKNIMGLAGGILSALNCPSFKSYLLARGPVEVGRLISAMGGNYQTAFGLSHLGDFGATVFSGFSYNHQAGELWVKERKLSEMAEGIPTLKAVKVLMEKYKVDMPICEAIYKILYKKMAPQELIKALLNRKTEPED